MDKPITISVYRHNPNGESQERYEDYQIPHQVAMSVLNALEYVRENYDSSLSFYQSCRIGRCLGCYVEVNGKVKLACTTLVSDQMRIGPHKRWKLIKDLAVNFGRDVLHA